MLFPRGCHYYHAILGGNEEEGALQHNPGHLPTSPPVRVQLASGLGGSLRSSWLLMFVTSSRLND